MTFLNPLLLLGALGISLPILAHLINRQQVNRTDWAAMRFLDAQVRVRSRQVRLRDLLLLAMRCLALILLVFALARPAANSADSAWLPGEERAGVVVAVDASFSMAHSDGGPTRFERAIGQARVIGEHIKPGDPVTLVMNGGDQRVVLRNVAYDADRFAQALEGQDVVPEPMDVDSVPKRLEALAEDMDAVKKEVYLITDTQSPIWAEPTPQFRQALNELSQVASVLLVPVPGGDDNLAVTGLDLVSGTLRKGTVARYRATVQNFGDEPASNIEVRCGVDGVQIDSKRIPLIAPDSSETVSLFVPFYNAGATKITAEITDGSLAMDNMRRAVAVVRDRVSVLCLDGSRGGAGRLIESALLARPQGAEDEEYVVRGMQWPAFPPNLDDVDVVIMAGVAEVTPDQAEQLERFVRRGSGLVWFAGEDVKASKWNELAAKKLLPAKLGVVADARDTLGVGRPLDPNMPDHTVCRPLASLPEDLLSETRFIKRMKVEPWETSFAVLSLAGSSSPLLLEHSLGRGHVFMFTSSADTVWNNMAQTPVFPMLMQQVVTYLVGREFERPRVVGDALTLSYVEPPDATDAVFDTPSEKSITVPVREHRGEFVAVLEQSTEAGFYTARVSVQSPGMPIAVNVDTSESDVACVEADDLREGMKGTGVSVSASEAELSSEISAARTGRSSWRYFMIAALVFLVGESLLADRMVRRKDPAAAKPSEPAPEPIGVA